MTRDQKRLLLYLETCAVDHSGLVVPAHMNGADFAQANAWDDLGFIAFRRRPMAEIETAPKCWPATHWVRLSGEAWNEAHKLRQERGQRLERKEDLTEASG